MNNCVETERQALLKFKDAIIHGNANFTSWKGEGCCKWEGISCDNLTGHVTSLYLQPLDYSSWPEVYKGKLDSSICKLQHLTSLNLKNNYLQGNIPKCIGSLGQLIELKLSGNQFVSVIPSSLRNLSNLQTLDLSYNYYMISNNLEWLSHLSNLRYLDLSYVNLTLAIDWLLSISKISSLNEIRLVGCKLHQVTPRSILRLNSSMSLKYLDLGGNSLNSSILPWVINVSIATTLSLRSTNIVGTLPKSFVHLPSLKTLDLSHNQLNGVDIIDNAHLSTLQSLDLSFNQLNGSLPLLEITKLPSLQLLDLSHNQLSGQFPHITAQFSNLMMLLLSSNKLSGVINEVILSNLSQLKTLDVTQNSISFNISSYWIPLFQLDTLYASSCTLGPKFPAWLKHQRELMSLDISNTGISDSFPKWFWNLSSTFQYLNVSHNKLEGPLPKSFPRLNALFLSNLSYLDLSNNLLAGKLSDCWEKFQRLQVLNLAKNNLSGKILNSFGALNQIESIHLNNNNFFGEIPPLTHCSSLTLIDVGDNNLQGILPKWIGYHLHQLIVLRLRGNKLKGNIPTSMCNLSFLQVLDLSENNITGEIPQRFRDIIALSDLKSPRKSFHYISFSQGYMENEEYEIGSFNDKEILALKGSNREYGRNLGLMATIDLSCNHLTGEIPQSITKLVALVGLNLSRNNLTGFIPNNIGHMERLESLDLSRNHLYGKMPSSFTNLTFLSYMNLSFNNLEGKIPLSTQLQSFDPSSFVGNARLCGSPRIKLCLDDAISPTRSHEKHVTDEDEDEDKLITFGFYVSLVVGFFVGFWGVCGTLVIKTSWRHAYFQFFKNMNDWIHVTLAVFVNRLKNRFQVQD
ncbi:receptor protein EIX2 [Trifolium repens]|nr:receptor protein EIX2 [Trifolium repens]